MIVELKDKNEVGIRIVAGAVRGGIIKGSLFAT